MQFFAKFLALAIVVVTMVTAVPSPKDGLELSARSDGEEMEKREPICRNCIK